MKQGSLIEDLATKIDKVAVENRKETNLKVSNLENRIVNFYTDQEKQCTEKKKQITANFDKRIDKVASKLDNAMRSFSSVINDAPAQPPTNSLKDIDTKLNNIQTNVDKVECEMANMQDTICALGAKDTSFFSVGKSGNLRQTNNFTPFSVGAEGKDSPLTTQMKMAAKNSNSNKSAAGETRSQNQSDDSFLPPKDDSDGKRKMWKSLLFMDSNRKHLVADKLFKNLKIIPCSSTQELRKKLLLVDLKDIDLVFIHTGVNDIDKDDGKTVADNLVEIVKEIRSTLPKMKIAISEITPRQLHRDDEVLKCNTALHAALDNQTNITIARHTNLRDETWTFHMKNDDKHLTELSIAKFAKNLKVAFRKALGLPVYEKRNNDSAQRKSNFKPQKGLGEVHTFKKKLMHFLSNC